MSFTPETGTIGTTSRHFRDSDGTIKKQVQRTLDEKVVTETFLTDEEGKMESSRSIATRELEPEQLKDFDVEWERRSESLNNKPFVTLLPTSPRLLPASPRFKQQDSNRKERVPLEKTKIQD